MVRYHRKSKPSRKRSGSRRKCSGSRRKRSGSRKKRSGSRRKRYVSRRKRSGSRRKRSCNFSEKILKQSSMFIKVRTDCNTLNNWNIRSHIAGGFFGQAYYVARTKRKNARLFVLKKQYVNEEFMAEATALTELQGWKGVPELIDVWICDNIGYIILERLYNCVWSPTDWGELKKLLDELHGKDYVHADVTVNNVRCTKKGKLKLIDFGLAVKFPGKRGRIKNHHLLTRFEDYNTVTHKSTNRHCGYLNYNEFLALETFGLDKNFHSPKSDLDKSTKMYELARQGHFK
jgi:hypothetical protein